MEIMRPPLWGPEGRPKFGLEYTPLVNVPIVPFTPPNAVRLKTLIASARYCRRTDSVKMKFFWTEMFSFRYQGLRKRVSKNAEVPSVFAGAVTYGAADPLLNQRMFGLLGSRSLDETPVRIAAPVAF